MVLEGSLSGEEEVDTEVLDDVEEMDGYCQVRNFQRPRMQRVVTVASCAAAASASGGTVAASVATGGQPGGGGPAGRT